jgi:ribosomal RNA-processing protein 36
MAVAKRKIESILGRRVRPRVEKNVGPARAEEEEEEEDFEGFGGHSDDDGSAPERGEEDSEDDEDGESDEDSAPEEESAHDISKVTFGQLARAQESLAPKTGKRSAPSEAPASAKAAAASAKDARRGVAPKAFGKRAPPPSRSSKHAPAEMTSKRAVKRGPSSATATSSNTTRFVPRDPRFDPAILSRSSHAATHEEKNRRAYSFLDEHRAHEARDMRAKLRDKKVPDGEKERIRRELTGMESRQRTRARQELEKRVRDEHMQRERQLASEQGKKPYFLKKAELRKRVLTEQFAGMSAKQAERAVERRRKKVSGREKKEMGSLERRR